MYQFELENPENGEKKVTLQFVKQEILSIVEGICNKEKVNLSFLIKVLNTYKKNNKPFDEIHREYWKTYIKWNLSHANTKFNIPTLYDFLYGAATTEQKEDLDYMRPELSVEYVHKKRV